MYGLIIALAISLVCAWLLYRLFQQFWPLLYNAMAGIGIFWVLNYLHIISVPINFWTVFIAAIGGVFGVAAVIVLTYLGVPVG